ADGPGAPGGEARAGGAAWGPPAGEGVDPARLVPDPALVGDLRVGPAEDPRPEVPVRFVPQGLVQERPRLAPTGSTAVEGAVGGGLVGWLLRARLGLEGRPVSVGGLGHGRCLGKGGGAR